MTKVTDLALTQTAPALTDFIHQVDVSDTTDNAAGSSNKMLMAYLMKVYSGTAFPTANLWDGMPFIRTDLDGLECFYDLTNTQWLTRTQYSADVPSANYTATGASTTYWVGNNYAMWIDRIAMRTKVATTLDATHNYTIIARSFNITGGTETFMTVETSGDTVDAWTDHDGAPSTAALTNYGGLQFSVTKNNTPGTLTLQGSIYYRLIVT